MSDLNIESLLHKLIKKTQQNEAEWKTTYQENEFALQFHVGKITIWEGENSDVMSISIYNNRYELLHEQDLYKGTAAHTMLSDLYTLAQKSYYKREETIAEIIKELDAEGKIGESTEEDVLDLPF